MLAQLRGQLIVSCQALADEPLHGSEMMARMALAAWQGGAGGIRANSPEDIRAIRAMVPLPIIGLYKDGSEGVYITPTFRHAQAIAEAGADIIALDATPRPRPNGVPLGELIQKIHTELGKPVLADVSTLEEGLQAVQLGADIIAPTLAGYTPDSPPREAIDLELLRAMVEQAGVPVIAEGHINTPELAQAALGCGVWAVVVGSAITRPQWITAQFAKAMAK